MFVLIFDSGMAFLRSCSSRQCVLERREGVLEFDVRSRSAVSHHASFVAEVVQRSK
ncbi:hypothetical protein ABZ805_03830 [Saccharopolyspora sp. NPDC047091]|uniref:hypothetical protein n=1 Tax=Saccharopolyspora sp. NPDC047091 TaxID=3155924 RepID=UPI0033ED5ABE